MEEVDSWEKLLGRSCWKETHGSRVTATRRLQHSRYKELASQADIRCGRLHGGVVRYDESETKSSVCTLVRRKPRGCCCINQELTLPRTAGKVSTFGLLNRLPSFNTPGFVMKSVFVLAIKVSNLSEALALTQPTLTDGISQVRISRCPLD
ncbi:hypothetical protein RvY_07779 [Ramazzottius varieornatus]|uniref:Uncharacterized protein n=1 Tax=Ramazzottius varieornatus TaxID=947166 RepID=A0A1D1V9G0_RAMVA|nr:hypothetical protein RvY_07779 [Ramazzottius varieornatus]